MYLYTYQSEFVLKRASEQNGGLNGEPEGWEVMMDRLEKT